MDMLSTKELSEKWQISTSRIVRLAKSGRIPGAVLIGKSWVFPKDTPKPSDNRKKENKKSPGNDKYRFPLYFYCNYSEKEIETDFDEEERLLYDGSRLYYSGKYQDCIDYKLCSYLLHIYPLALN